jgi:cytochrome c biogenesis protein CcmG/thiol:disulfide interchange protein DsbE
MNATQEKAQGDPGMRARTRNIVVLLPLLIFIGLAALFYFGLLAGDPSKLPSALIGKPAPPTNLPPIESLATANGTPVPGLTNATFAGKVTLVNVWASWCVPCHDEVPQLEKLSHDPRIQLVGINYKDAPDNARRFLNRYGNPFAAAGADANGRTSIDWGVYGVPETFLVGRDGTIAYKLVGPISGENLPRVLEPEIAKAFAKN